MQGKKHTQLAKKTVLDRKVTLDDLARMVANGFAHDQIQFNGLYHRMDGLEERMSNFEARMDVFDRRLAKLDDRISALAEDVQAHMRLYDKHYAEQERKNLIIAKYLRQIIEQSKLAIPTKELANLIK